MPRPLLRIATLLLLLLQSWLSHGQLTPVQNFTTEDGLPSNTVYSVSKDRQGYLWFATDKGLSRYNGSRFENLSTLDGMPDNEVFSVIMDYENRLWVLNYSGQLCFLKDNIFHTATNTPWLKLPFKAPQFRAYLQQDSSINFIFFGRPYFGNIRHNKVKLIPITNQPDYNPYYIRSLPGNRFEIYCPTVYYLVTGEGRMLHKVKYPKNKEFLPFNYYGSEALKLLGSDGIYSRDYKKTISFKSKRLINAPVIDISTSKEGTFIGLVDGLSIDDTIYMPLGETVTKIGNDRKSNYWITTKGKGVFKFSKSFRDLTEYKNQYNRPVLYARVIGDRLLYVTNDGSLYEFSNGKSKLRYKSTGTGSKGKHPYFTRANFFIDEYGNFFRFHLSGNQMVPYAKPGQVKSCPVTDIRNHAIKGVLSDGRYVYTVRPTVLIRRYEYAGFFKPGTPKADSIHLPMHQGNPRMFTHTIHPGDSTLWLSLAEGMYILRDTTITRHPYFPAVPLRQLYFPRNAALGIAEGNHLLVFNNYQNERIKVDTIDAGENIWEYIYPIDSNRCIVSTNGSYKVLSFHASTEGGPVNYTALTQENSFIPRDVEYVATSPDFCYFLKNGTITKVATRILFERNDPPTPVFKTLKTWENTHPIRPELTISYNESRSISLIFDNISFTGGNVSSEYSISENGEENWRAISGDEINLNKPGFGNFTIKIRSKTPSSSYSEPAVLQLTVLKPFWAKWWFLLCVLFIFIVLFWLILHFFTRRRLQKKQKEHDAEMKYQQAEYKALNALMNPHFIFNSLNNIQGLVNKNEKRIANEYLVIFSDLIRQNMHNISRGFISLQDEINLVENYLHLEKLRFKEYINYAIIIDDDLETDLILIPPLMIQPLVENAVKHGLLPKQSESNKVTIKIYEKDNLLFIEIEDNGVGLTYAQLHHSNLHESFGLANLQKRADYLKRIQKQKIDLEIKELIDEDGKILGTRAKITMELDEDNSEPGSGQLR